MLTTRGLLSIAERLDSVARYVTDAWSALEADDLLIAKIKYALAVRRSHAVLLLTIAVEPEKVHSREDLSRAVNCAGGKVIDVYLCAVRAALRKRGFGSPIRTKYRQGYWISPEDAERLTKLWQ